MIFNKEQRKFRNLSRKKFQHKKRMEQAITWNKQKFVIKINYSVKSLAVSIFISQNNNIIIHDSSFHVRKEIPSLKSEYCIKLMPVLAKRIIDKIQNKKWLRDMDSSNIIWYLGCKRYNGRIKAFCTCFQKWLQEIVTKRWKLAMNN